MDNKNLDRDLRNCAAIIRRVERDGFGRNAAATVFRVRSYFNSINVAILIREDAGIDVAPQTEKLWQLFDRSVRIGFGITHRESCETAVRKGLLTL